MLKRFFIWLLVVVFVCLSLPVLALIAVSNTFFTQSFYTSSASASAYDLLVTTTATNLINQDKLLQERYNLDTVKASIEKVFTLDSFKKIAADFGAQVIKIKDNPSKPIVISLKAFRDSLVTVANNMAFQVVNEISKCKSTELPQMDVRQLPTCISTQMKSEDIIAPLAARFDVAIDSVVPVQMQLDLNTIFGDKGANVELVYASLQKLKLFIYSCLLVVLILIGVVNYASFADLVKYEGIAFTASGLLGFVLAYGFYTLPVFVIDNFNLQSSRSYVLNFLNDIMGTVSGEGQKMALVFLGLGAVLILVRIYMIKSVVKEVKA